MFVEILISLACSCAGTALPSTFAFVYTIGGVDMVFGNLELRDSNAKQSGQI